MIWNWQQPDWPDFSWSNALLRKAEEEFLRGSDICHPRFKTTAFSPVM
jgi:hypothetical protein